MRLADWFVEELGAFVVFAKDSSPFISLVNWQVLVSLAIFSLLLFFKDSSDLL